MTHNEIYTALQVLNNEVKLAASAKSESIGAVLNCQQQLISAKQVMVDMQCRYETALNNYNALAEKLELHHLFG